MYKLFKLITAAITKFSASFTGEWISEILFNPFRVKRSNICRWINGNFNSSYELYFGRHTSK